jgi:hypothetical protein
MARVRAARGRQTALARDAARTANGSAANRPGAGLTRARSSARAADTRAADARTG